MKIKTKDISICAVFAALVAVGAFIKIPIPVCPITMQTLFVLMAGMLTGAKRGAISILIYMIIGLIGIPVFTQGGGIGYVMVPTFGYIIGFAAGAFVTGFICSKLNKLTVVKIFLAGLAGIAVIYLFGMTYYYFISNYAAGGNPIDLYNLFYFCFLLVIPGDLISCLVAALLAKRLIPVLKAMNF